MSATANPKPQNEKPANSPDVGDLVWDSAVEAVTSAFMVWLLGGIALSIAKGVAGDMVPSPPPFLPVQAEAETGASWFGGAWWHSVRGHAFALLFGMFFVHSVWSGWRGPKQESGAGGLGKRLGFMLDKIREDWFELIVGNAFGAWIGAVVLAWASGFSWTQILWHWLSGELFHGWQSWTEGTVGHERWSQIKDWYSWYDANQTKLTFWLLYLAGICDDLGLPNIKALARWLWRRRKKRSVADRATEMKGSEIRKLTGRLAE